jgi:hypothetical protein
MLNAILKFVIICVICGKKFKSECPDLLSKQQLKKNTIIKEEFQQFIFLKTIGNGFNRWSQYNLPRVEKQLHQYVTHG